MSNELSLSDAATVLGVRQETVLKLLDGALLTQTCESFNSDRPRFHAKVFQAQAERLRDRAEFGEADHYHDGHHGKHAGDFVVTKGRTAATGSRVRGSRRTRVQRPDAVIPQLVKAGKLPAQDYGGPRKPARRKLPTPHLPPKAPKDRGLISRLPWPARDAIDRTSYNMETVDNHGQVDTVPERGNERKPLPGR